MIKETFGEKVFGTFILIFLVLFTCLIVYPVILVISSSFSSTAEVMAGRVTFLPRSPTLSSYRIVFKNSEIFGAYRNTIVYTIVGTVCNVVITALTAYPLSRRDLFGRNIFTAMIIFTMFFGGGMIPTYFVVKGMKLTNTMWALILPNAISTFNLIIMRTFFTGIPIELQEAAFIDGANDIYVFVKLVLPLSTPVIAVMVLRYGVEHWNSWFSAILYLSERSKYPLQIILREILVLSSAASMAEDAAITDRELISEGIKYATMVVATLPIMCLYPFLQKHFAKGVMIGALKG